MGRVIFLGVIALLAGAVVLAAAQRIMGAEDDRRGGFDRGAPTPVIVTPAVAQEFADRVEALGTARSNENVTITSRVTDVIGRVGFESGDIVQAGDILVELVDAEEAADLREARATLTEALAERGRQIDLQSRGVASKARLDEAEAAVSRARARVGAVEARLADYIIKAPFDGVVGLREISEGALVRPGDAIVTLDDISQIKIDFTVPEQYLSVLQPGAEVDARASAYEDQIFTAMIESIASRVDPITRTGTVRAAVANTEARLRPGMLMLVDVRRNVKTSPAVPALSVQRRGDQSWVYVIASGPRGPVAEQRIVTTGRRADGLIEIVTGVSAGEEVVSQGVHRLMPGGAVRVVTPEDVAAAATGASRAASRPGGRPDTRPGARPDAGPDAGAGPEVGAAPSDDGVAAQEPDASGPGASSAAPRPTSAERKPAPAGGPRAGAGVTRTATAP